MHVCSYISGYKNQFQNFIKHLREKGDEVVHFSTVIGWVLLNTDAD